MVTADIAGTFDLTVNISGLCMCGTADSPGWYGAMSTKVWYGHSTVLVCMARCVDCGSYTASSMTLLIIYNINVYMHVKFYQVVHNTLMLYADVVSQGTWTLLNELEDPDLRSLASRLPSTILHSRADSTVRKYLGAFKRWKSWATQYKLATIPAKPHQFVLYLQHLSEETKSKVSSRGGL